MKSAGFHEIRMKSGGFQVKSGGFHEIWWISGEIHPKPCKIRRVFAETSAADFWNIWFHLKSTRFHGEICQISWISWNLPDFMKSILNPSRFHEIQWISGKIWQISWNQADFRWNPPPKPCKIRSFCWNICSWFLKHLISPEICQISWISWNPLDFMKSVCNLADFMKSGWISGGNLVDFMKSGRFQVKSTPNLVKSEEFLLKHLQLISETFDFTWNLPDFMVKSARFYGEIHQISWWNLLDFMNVSFWVMIKYRSFYWKTNQMFQQNLFWLVFWKTKDLYLIIMQKLIILKSGEFHEIWQISCGFKSSGFHEILGHSPPPCIHQTEEFLLKHLLL